MLPRALRLTDAGDFAHTVRRGRRAGDRLLVVHHAPDTGADPVSATVRVGFVVSRAVGGAVVRNQVKRRLRHLVAERIGAVVPGTLVVRAQPAAASATYRELGAALDRCLDRCTTSAERVRRPS